MQTLFAAGADDYVPKPIVAPELLTRITNRVERVALYRSLSDVDALTGVATRRAATEALERLLALSRRELPLALAVIDLDAFKQVNDLHGHAAGDRVLVAGPHAGVCAQRVDVVIVEDDPALSALLADTLGAAGLSVHGLADGRAAVSALSGPEPALRARVVLLDVDLPGVHGLTVLRRLAADRVLRGTRAVMLTARSAEVEVVTALELGAFDHVAKPFSLPILMQRVRRALESMP